METGKTILIGTSGYSFPDWKGEVYPKKIKSGEMLDYYEQELGFTACEINYTYYRQPSPYIMYNLAKKVDERFEFTVKANREMTHDIWQDKKRSKLKSNSKVFKEYLKGIEPLAASRKLGAVLLQFPSFFFPNEQNFEYVDKCKKRLKGLPLVIEFRNKGWLKAKTFDYLKKEKVGICVVDEPQLPRLLPYQPEATSEIGYFRFHGRNKEWYSAGAHDRYNYLYSKKELEEFLPGIKEVQRKTKKTYLFFNNCFMGQSVKNAVQIRQMLGIKFQKRSPKLF
ncbi:DUF72 domain-containing protein [Candidatus Margulisiibacteriota bacterium]